MSLQIAFAEVTAEESREVFAPAWVVLTRSQDPPVLAWPFATRIDAEIALRVLPDTGIDFDAPHDEFDRQWAAFGGREAVMEFICKRLRW